MNNSLNTNGGFAIISSVMILSIILLLISSATAISVQGYLQQDQEIEQWMIAQRLSEGCMEMVLQQLREDSTYNGNETLTIGTESCTIRPLIGGGTTTIQTEATISGHLYRLEVELDNTTDMNILSWKHVGAF